MCCTRNCWRRPGRRRWTTGARDPRPSCPSGSERGQARSPETPSPPMMRMRDRLRLPRVLRKRKRRKRKRMRRRRKRRSKRGQIVRQEEPPIHLRNCSLSQLLHKTTAVDSCCTLQKQTLRPSRENLQMFQFYVHGIFSVSSTNKLFFPLCDLTLHSLPISWVAFQN